MPRHQSFVSDREHEVLRAVACLATSNPFLPDRIEHEARALGSDFVQYAPVWHMDGEITGVNPNIESLRGVAERMAADLRERLASGARASVEQLHLYEGFIRYLFFYRYESEFTKLISAAAEGRPTTKRLAFYSRFQADFDHFFALPKTRLPFEPDPAHTLAWGFQVRRAFHHTYWQIYGSSLPIAELRGAVWRSIFTHDIERYRRSLYNMMGNIPTMILGESGTGKELVARAIGLSRYVAFDAETQAFTADYASEYQVVNLSALSSTLIESELFGHKRGSFTGASEDRKGWFDSTGSHGTIFLDEIGELEPSLQVKLLRVLQGRVYQRIGETKDRRFEGKIVAATNRDLDVEIEAGRFREDFYYRLCADVVRMPTLREQVAGSPDELRSLLAVIARRIAGEEAEVLTEEVLRWIHAELPQDYAWPGNVRELEQCVRSILVQGSYMPRKPPVPPLAAAGIAPTLLQGEANAEDLLRDYVTRVYAQKGSYEAAARSLGLDRRTVKAKVDPELLQELTGG
jgi:transcriptional regulator with AAA-type ATPase domain